MSKDLLRTHTQCCIVLKIIHLCWKIRKISTSGFNAGSAFASCFSNTLALLLCYNDKTKICLIYVWYIFPNIAWICSYKFKQKSDKVYFYYIFSSHSKLIKWRFKIIKEGITLPQLQTQWDEFFSQVCVVCFFIERGLQGYPINCLVTQKYENKSRYILTNFICNYWIN